MENFFLFKNYLIGVILIVYLVRNIIIILELLVILILIMICPHTLIYCNLCGGISYSHIHLITV